MAMCADTGVGLVPYSPQGKGRLARPWGEQSTRSTVDHVVQAFDSPLDEPVVNAVEELAQALASRWPRSRSPGFCAILPCPHRSSAQRNRTTYPKPSPRWNSS